MTRAEPEAPTSEGSLIAGKYRLESLVGEGGMGSVWRAFNLQLEVPVALKLLRSDVGTEDLAERLRVEARAIAKMVHPSIVRVFDIGESEAGDPFIVMEFLQGDSMGALLERGPLFAADAVQLLLPIAEALVLAHSRGVVHRDIKPDNIFLAREGAALQPKLLDFGIAKVKSAMASGARSLTQSGMLLGSPDYMSPEQAYGRADIDERSDIWSFCVVLYEAICGEPPFSGDSCQAILRSVVGDTPLPLMAMADVDPILSALVDSGLSKAREARPTSMFALGRDLALWLLSQGVRVDATGASLEAKWLERTKETLSFGTRMSFDSNHDEHEQATLVSVVHPLRHAHDDEPSEAPPSSRRPSWRSGAALAAAGLTVGGLWMSSRALRPASERTTAAVVASASPALYVSPVSSISPPPAVPAATATALAPGVPAAFTVVAALAREAARRQVVPPPTPQLEPLPATLNANQPLATLPEALPQAPPNIVRPAAPARSERTDLLNPY